MQCIRTQFPSCIMQFIGNPDPLSCVVKRELSGWNRSHRCRLMQSSLILLMTDQLGTTLATRMDNNERNHIKSFDCQGDRNTLGLRWKCWLIAFELFADGKGLILNEENANNRQRRRALLLHLAGTDVQDIFYILPDTGDAKDYKKAVDALNAYFVPKVDTTYEQYSSWQFKHSFQN